MTLHLLIVEDDERTILPLYAKTIAEWNEEHRDDTSIEFVVAKNSDAAKQALRDNDFDAAVVDLKLTRGGAPEVEGNDILDLIFEKLRFPAYVVSGNLGDLDEKYKTNHFILPFGRDTPFADVLKKISAQFSTGITRILGQRGHFEAALINVFWNHLPSALPHWEGQKLEAKTKEKQLLRYTLAHLQEILDIDENGDEEKRNPAEVYIKPPVRAGLVPGLVLRRRSDDSLWLIITPACDLSQRNAEYLQLVKIVKLQDQEKVKTKARSEARKQVVEKFVGNKNQRYHFLPAYDDIEPSVIDFQQVVAIPKNEAENAEAFTKIACISPSFFKDIVARFASLYARQGSPDFDIEALSVDINNNRLPAAAAPDNN